MSMEPGIKVENANDSKVFYYIDKVLSENPGYCKCHRCRLDTAALALNTLPPHYFTDPTHAKAYDLGSPWVLIEMAVVDAMEKVNMFPHHAPKTLEGMDHTASPQPLQDTAPDA